MKKHAFSAMGVAIECIVETDVEVSGEFAAAEEEFRRLERVFSRFDAESELSRLNRAGAMRCSAEMVEVTQLALRARDATDGRFDPTVHDAVAAAGYDRTFAELAPDRAGPAPAAQPCGGSVDVDENTGVVTLGPGVSMDLGGIVKGWAAERVCGLLEHAGPCLVNAAGDIAVRGVPASGSWPVERETPAGPVVLGLTHGGIATSGRDYRRWQRGGAEQHHLIDPATGTPSASDLVTVTVVAPDAVEAEVLAKALFLAGERAALAEAEERGIACLLVNEDERVVVRGIA